MLDKPMPTLRRRARRPFAERTLLLAVLACAVGACGPLDDTVVAGGEEELDARLGATSAVALPGRLQAEDYLPKGEGRGYHDTTRGNSGGEYRSDRVDIERTSGGGYNVGWTEPGEWLAFEVTTEESATFSFSARVASATASSKQLHLNIDGQDLPRASFTGTGGWQTWTQLSLGEHALSAGKHLVKVIFDTSGTNLDFIDIQRVTAPSTPKGVTALTVSPQSVQAAPGTSFPLTYNFSGGPTSEDLTVFVHFLDAAGNIAFGDDHAPPSPTSTWSGSIGYTRTVTVPSTLPDGTYRIAVGLYSPTTGARLALQVGPGVEDIGSFRYVTGTLSTTSSPPSAGPPSITSKGSFVERTYARQYALTGMQLGPTGDPVANGNRMRAVLASALPGDLITVAPGHYRLAGIIEFVVPNVTLKGLGATREEVWFEHTTEHRATFMVKAGGIHFYNFTHRVHATARSSLGQSGEGNIWVQGGHSGFRMQDVLAWGSRDAAIFLYGVHHFELNRVESRDSRSDAYHVTNGSSFGTWYDCKSTNSGDDGIGFVGYDAEGPGTPHHHTVVRHHVAKQSPNGRGIGIIHVNNINIHGPTLIEDSWGAGIILARESHYGSGAVRAIRIFGELRLRRSNASPAIEHGAIHINNPDTVAPIEDVLIEGPVVLVDTGKNRPGGVPYQVRAHGAGKIQAEIRNVLFYGSGPSTKLSLSLSSGSWVTTPGWSNASAYLGMEPAFPLP